MSLDWMIREDAWSFAQEAMRSGELGDLAEVCVQQVVPHRPDGGWSQWCEAWRGRLAEFTGEATAVRLLDAGGAASALFACGDGPIVRLFADERCDGVTPWMGFEVVGKARSLIYRPMGAVLGAIHGADGAFELVADRPLSLDDPSPGDPLRLGVWSMEHPHATGNHFPALWRISGRVRVRAIGDTDPARSEAWRQRFGAEHAGSLEALLSRGDLDAVLITSRNDRHADDAIACGDAGVAVFCDKPIATTRADATRLERAFAGDAPRFVTTYPCRFHPAVQRLRAAIASGRLGRVEAIMATNHGCMYEPNVPDWVKDPAHNGGGCIIDHTVHVADLIRWLSGAEFAHADALAATRLRDISAEDIAVMHGRLTDGALFQIDASWSRRGGDPCWGDVTLRVVASEGSATLDLYNNQAVQLYTPGGVELRYPDLLIRDHAMIFEDHRRERITGRRGCNADAIDGLRSVELALSAYESLRQGEAVKVSPRSGEVSLA